MSNSFILLCKKEFKVSGFFFKFGLDWLMLEFGSKLVNQLYVVYVIGIIRIRWKNSDIKDIEK